MKTDILFYKLFEMQSSAMIDTTEIFDDIQESVAVQQYAQENKLESVPSLLQLGLMYSTNCRSTQIAR